MRYKCDALTAMITSHSWVYFIGFLSEYFRHITFEISRWQLLNIWMEYEN